MEAINDTVRGELTVGITSFHVNYIQLDFNIS